MKLAKKNDNTVVQLELDFGNEINSQITCPIPIDQKLSKSTPNYPHDTADFEIFNKKQSKFTECLQQHFEKKNIRIHKMFPTKLQVADSLKIFKVGFTMN